MKTVDVIIPTYKPGSEFQNLLKRLADQTYPISNIIIINTEKSFWDAMADADKIEKQYANVIVRHITKQEFDHAKTRQMAVGLSQADIFVMMTMDALPKDKRLIEELVCGLSVENVAVCYARQMAKDDAQLIEAYTRAHNYPSQDRLKTKADLKELGIKTYFCSDVCAAYHRRLFEELGGYVESAIFNEDMLYAAKAIEKGYGVYYAAKAEVYHSHNYSGMQQLKRNFDLGVSQAMHPEVFESVPSESAGIAMVKKTAGYVCQCKKPWLIIKLVWQSGCKYIGYRLGKMYKKLPREIIMMCTSSPGYWMK